MPRSLYAISASSAVAAFWARPISGELRDVVEWGLLASRNWRRRLRCWPFDGMGGVTCGWRRCRRPRRRGPEKCSSG